MKKKSLISAAAVAILTGDAKPPVKPVDGESGASELDSFVTLLPKLLVIHAC